LFVFLIGLRAVTTYGNTEFGLVTADFNDPTHNSFGLTGGLTGVDTDTAGWYTTLAGILNPCPADCNYPNGHCDCGYCSCNPGYTGEYCECTTSGQCNGIVSFFFSFFFSPTFRG
jgi:hypothetical protein